MTVSDMPALNASLNGLAGLFLLVGFVMIRGGRKDAHRACMISAFLCSCVFLICYVAHKILVHGVHTPFGGTGLLKTGYYVMLFSHILLAIAVVPMALITMRRAMRGEWESHKKLARWTWPIWMYVSVTGVLIYFMLYQWFPVAKTA